MTNRFGVKFRQSIISFVMTWIAILVFIGIVSLFTIWSMNKAYHQSDLHATSISMLNNEILSAQVDFKIQVQEWKNILLRGKNPDDYKRYYFGFVQEKEKVQKSLDTASKTCMSIQINFDCKKIMAIMDEHQKMGVIYQEKLTIGSLENYENIHKLDQSVRGIDRNLENKLDAIGLELFKIQSNERLTTQLFLNNRYIQLREFIVIVMSLALIVTIVSLYSVLRTLSD